jgi:hypothetical protein
MIHVDFDPTKLADDRKAWWVLWHRRAARATARVIAAAGAIDLRLMSSVDGASGLPTTGARSIIVAEVNHVLHFRIFDGDGTMAIDTDEKGLAEQALRIEELRAQLQSLWPPHELTKGEKARVVEVVISIVGHTPVGLPAKPAGPAEKKKGAKAAKGGAVHFNQQIWKDLKDWLRENVFHGKCAYCETLIEAGFYGDAEHYRPKGEVRVADQVIQVNGRPHPGYYWLAYHWKNLIPSCQACNSGRGKGSQFPIALGKTHVSSHDPVDHRDDPDELDTAEDPLLLHPYRDEPSKSLAFGLKGIITALDDRGQATIDLCDLKRDKLEKWRQIHQESAWSDYMQYVAQGKTDQFAAEYRARPYYAAVAFYIIHKWAENRPLL